MMHSKAMIFDDTEIAEEILKEKAPSLQKQLGRRVSGFSDEVWDCWKIGIVRAGVAMKFAQNDELLKELLSHEGKIFVEASPVDYVWGIGFREEVALDHIEEWGENLLGKILTEVSELINT